MSEQKSDLKTDQKESTVSSELKPLLGFGGFAVMGNKGFHITFPNGVTLSTQIGGGNYCDNYDFQIGQERNVDKMESANAEIAIWNKGHDWITEQMQRELLNDKSEYLDSVLGRVDMETWLKIVRWCQEWEG